MSSTELIPPGPETSEATVSVTIREIIESYNSAGSGSPLDPARADAGSAARDDKPADSGSSRRTGMRSWLDLLLLPVAIGTFPLWLSF